MRNSLRHHRSCIRALSGWARSVCEILSITMIGNRTSCHTVSKMTGLVSTIRLDAVFDRIELIFELEGTHHSSVIIKMYRQLPRLEFTYRIAKTLSEDIESVYLTLRLNLPGTRSISRTGAWRCARGLTSFLAATWNIIWRTTACCTRKGHRGCWLTPSIHR